MIVLYTTLLLVFRSLQSLVRRKAAALERQFVRVAGEADTLLRQTSFKEGNSKRPDPYQSARRHYELGRLVEKRDAVEARYTAWQGTAEKFAACNARLRRWQGKFLPYAFGVLDVALVLAVLDYLGDGSVVNLRPMLETVTALLGR